MESMMVVRWDVLTAVKLVYRRDSWRACLMAVQRVCATDLQKVGVSGNE